MKGKSLKKGRDWIMEKKERRRRQGRYVHSSILNWFLFLELVVSVTLADTSSLSAVCFVVLQGGSS